MVFVVVVVVVVVLVVVVVVVVCFGLFVWDFPPWLDDSRAW